MLVDVALPLPLFRTFTYSVPESDAAKARRGMRAVVPFRNRKEIGIIVSEGREQNGIIPKLVDSLPDSEPVVSPSILSLCEWIAEYYVVPLGVALRTALPGALASHVAPEPVRRTRRVAALHRELPSLMHRDRVFARAPQQRALFELIESLGGRVPVEHLTARLNFSASVLKGVVARGVGISGTGPDDEGGDGGNRVHTEGTELTESFFVVSSMLSANSRCRSRKASAWQPLRPLRIDRAGALLRPTSPRETTRALPMEARF